jgi:hypothetical protein
MRTTDVVAGMSKMPEMMAHGIHGIHGTGIFQD